MTVEAGRSTLCAGLQMAISSRLVVNNGFSPYEALIVTLCWVLHRQRLDLFKIVSSPRKFAECLYCDASSPPILPVLSGSIKFTCHVQFIQSYKLHSYIHTIIHSYINIFTYSHTISIHRWLHQSPKVLLGRILSSQSSIISSCQS
jgi:hypothetical protein